MKLSTQTRQKLLLTTLLGASVLVPGMALAKDGPWGARPEGAVTVSAHVHSDSCHHGPPPSGAPSRAGRYELQTVSQWVPGRYEQVWVPEQCREHVRRHGRSVHCRGGFYEQRWVPGYYTQAEQWVWVPAPTYDGYGHDHGHGHHRYGRRPTGDARITVSARF